MYTTSTGYTKTDIFFITLFIVVVSIIIGLNIVMVVDKKLSNVSVNIPPFKLPEPNIVFNVCKDSKDIINITHGTSKHNELNVSNKLNKDDKIKDIENFTVSDAQDVTHYDEIKDKLFSEPDTFSYPPKDQGNCESSDPPVFSKARKPEKSVMVTDDPPLERYRKGRLDKAYITTADFGWDAPPQAVSCANSSIAEQYKTGNKSLLPNQIACGWPNKLTSENFYKTYYKAQVIPIEDYHVRGANYGDFSVFPTPYQTRYMRILSQNTKGLPPDQTKYKNIPIAYNFGFHNTPAMPMP